MAGLALGLEVEGKVGVRILEVASEDEEHCGGEVPQEEQDVRQDRASIANNFGRVMLGLGWGADCAGAKRTTFAVGPQPGLFQQLFSLQESELQPPKLYPDLQGEGDELSGQLRTALREQDCEKALEVVLGRLGASEFFEMHVRDGAGVAGEKGAERERLFRLLEESRSGEEALRILRRQDGKAIFFEIPKRFLESSRMLGQKILLEAELPLLVAAGPPDLQFCLVLIRILLLPRLAGLLLPTPLLRAQGQALPLQRRVLLQIFERLVDCEIPLHLTPNQSLNIIIELPQQQTAATHLLPSPMHHPSPEPPPPHHPCRRQSSKRRGGTASRSGFIAYWPKIIILFGSSFLGRGGEGPGQQQALRLQGQHGSARNVFIHNDHRQQGKIFKDLWQIAPPRSLSADQLRRRPFRKLEKGQDWQEHCHQNYLKVGSRLMQNQMEGSLRMMREGDK